MRDMVGRVVIAEDDAGLAFAFGRIVEGLGYEVARTRIAYTTTAPERSVSPMPMYQITADFCGVLITTISEAEDAAAAEESFVETDWTPEVRDVTQVPDNTKRSTTVTVSVQTG